jgi:subtilase family serine protease
MNRVLMAGLVSALVGFGLSSGADAQGLRVERSGSTFNVAVCPQVVGLFARCHAHIVTDAKGQPLVHSRGTVSGYGPSDLRDAYKITATGSSSTIVAIVDAFGYPNAETDLGIYRAQFGLPPCTTANGCFKKLNQKGKEKNYPGPNTGWAQESALDMDMVSAMCPNCTIYLVEGNTNSFKDLGIAAQTAASLGAHVISNSYGGPEGHYVNRFNVYYDHPGVAVTASTGDDGYGVQFPADSPTVIAVGGTSLSHDSSPRGWHETVWSGAGSGCSHFQVKPTWQVDRGCRGRTVGDVSAIANPATGVAVYGPLRAGTSGWFVIGGTSVAAPLIGGVFGANGGTVDSASTIYANSTALFDVTSGSNGDCGTKKRKQYLCTGEIGYDGPTGLGTPNSETAFGNP